MSWWRALPHPTYGNFGGAENTGDRKLEPVDWMDMAFKRHDLSLKKAKDNKRLIKEADCRLLRNLRRGDSTELDYFVYGRIYRLGATLLFSIICNTQ